MPAVLLHPVMSPGTEGSKGKAPKPPLGIFEAGTWHQVRLDRLRKVVNTSCWGGLAENHEAWKQPWQRGDLLSRSHDPYPNAGGERAENGDPVGHARGKDMHHRVEAARSRGQSSQLSAIPYGNASNLLQAQHRTSSSELANLGASRFCHGRGVAVVRTGWVFCCVS